MSPRLEPFRRELTWRLNWYRQSELEGALLLGRMVRLADTRDLVCNLTSHCADEARHGWMWAMTLAELGLPMLRIARSYQSYYADEPGGTPAGMAEVLALTHVFEQRVHLQFTRELERGGLPDAARRTLRRMLADEDQHLDWVSRWLANREDGAALVERFRAIDQHVYERVRPFHDRLWELPGLGSELADLAEPVLQ